MLYITLDIGCDARIALFLAVAIFHANCRISKFNVQLLLFLSKAAFYDVKQDDKKRRKLSYKR